MRVFVVFLPPPWPPRIRTSVRMVDAIVGWGDGERKDTPTTGWTVGAARSGLGTGGGTDGGGGTTVSGSAGVEYQWSHASILDATAA